MKDVFVKYSHSNFGMQHHNSAKGVFCVVCECVCSDVVVPGEMGILLIYAPNII